MKHLQNQSLQLNFQHNLALKYNRKQAKSQLQQRRHEERIEQCQEERRKDPILERQQVSDRHAIYQQINALEKEIANKLREGIAYMFLGREKEARALVEPRASYGETNGKRFIDL